MKGFDPRPWELLEIGEGMKGLRVRAEKNSTQKARDLEGI